uniref:YbcC family protein n=1 Tax=Flavobacterium sp. TaxID=239 RepID=UPI00404A7434
KSLLSTWREHMIKEQFDVSSNPRIGQFRKAWKEHYKINLDKSVHGILFKVLCSYLDQGVSMWSFPVDTNGFLASIRNLETHAYQSFFNSARAKKLLFQTDISIESLLHILVGDKSLYEQYVFDQQFAHPGWSGLVAVVESLPTSLSDARTISLKELNIFELLLEIDTLDEKFGENWAPLSFSMTDKPKTIFETIEKTTLQIVLEFWQTAYEWTYYDTVLNGIKQSFDLEKHPVKQNSFQALFCMDDRECSIRRHVEFFDNEASTFGTPGFYNAAFYFKPQDAKFYTKLCPAPMTPKHLIKEISKTQKHKKDLHYNKQSHSLLWGWIISQTLGFSAAFKLFLNIFRPSVTPATSASFKHLDADADLTIENKSLSDVENGLQVGFTIDEMTQIVNGQLESIGLVSNFSSIVYIISHGATSVNNTHYAGYDCGACSGRPGSVNAKVFCYMANHPKVREQLKAFGIYLTSETTFVAGLHDTTRDEMMFYDIQKLPANVAIEHEANEKVFLDALDANAHERSRRFDTIDSKQTTGKVHEKIRRRSVSLFEPRPELNHATNALCVVGRRNLTKSIFLDRRSFMNSYDYAIDPDGSLLYGILAAVAPVGGGINLEYYFSRVDNEKLGAGSKLPHNVMGLIGVANGIDGDLRSGLPMQMVEIHDPLRLLVIVEQLPEVVLKTIQKVDRTYEWFKNDWVRLAVVHPENHTIWVFENEQFVQHNPENLPVEALKNILTVALDKQENLPIFHLNN